jgi:hypothetical protein
LSLAALTAAAIVAAAAVGAVLRHSASATAFACPAGYQLASTAEAAEQAAFGLRGEAGGGDFRASRTCVAVKHPEAAIDLEIRARSLATMRNAPFKDGSPGAYAAAVRTVDAMKKDKTTRVPGTEGAWSRYGTGPLITDGAAYSNINGYGFGKVMGRIDDLKYDAATGRLFSANGTGGVWMSDNLGDSWRSIGDNLPSQIVGAVAWTTAGGGTVLALSGDPTFGSYQYPGFGAFYSTDLGQTWQKAAGIPDGALGFALEVDPTNPLEVYAGTLFGLYRSMDGGKTYTNVNLPTGECAGVPGSSTGRPECQVANVVTDVVIKSPGGVASDVPAGTVVAVVGWRGGRRKNSDGTVQSPNNGVYRSDSGAPNTFRQLAASGFAAPERIGRTELGTTVGALQDHDYLYAIVQDSILLAGGLDLLDAPEGVNDPPPIGPARASGGTVLNAIYVSSDFGATWIKMADRDQIAKNPATGSALAVTQSALGYEPGVQAWYNQWIAPDPTRQSLTGVPTRLSFGLEEVWQNEITAQPMDGPTSFKVIGRYVGDKYCLGLGLGLAACPANRPPDVSKTTHPDQQASAWVPDATGGVSLLVSNDGGFYKQHVGAAEEMDNGKWTQGSNAGFNTLLPYDVAVANDGTVWAGLQDNGHMKITPSGTQYATYAGDGTMAEVDPDHGEIAYQSLPGGSMNVTTDGGRTWRAITPSGMTAARFVHVFQMDPTNAKHLVTAGNEVFETVAGPQTNDGGAGHAWTKVFDLGTQKAPGTEAAPTGAGDATNQVSAIGVRGTAAYVAYCGVCDILNATAPFKSGIATNVGGSAAPESMTSKGWHIATAAGLPNRYITSIAVDPASASTIYVTLGGYTRRWIPPGSLQDANTNVGEGHLFKSTDAGEHFVDITGNLPDVPATSVIQRANQLIVGTDLGVFANSTDGGTTFAYLKGLPVVPISALELKPDNPNVMFAATYGRSIWTFQFTKLLPGTGTGTITSGEPPPTPTGANVAGPYGFEAGAEGWTVTSSGGYVVPHEWKRGAPGAMTPAFSFQIVPYLDLSTSSLASPVIQQSGGWLFINFQNRRDLEPGFDFMNVEWSSDGGTNWYQVPFRFDPATQSWSEETGLGYKNPGHPAFAAERFAVKAPAGPFQVRFRLTSDDYLSGPVYEGVYVDDVVITK